MQNWKHVINACRELLVGETGLGLSISQIRAERGLPAKDAEYEFREVILGAKAFEWPPRRRDPVIAVAVEKTKQLREQKCAQKQSLMQVLIQVTASHEDSVQANSVLADYVEAVCDVLARNEGQWAQGVHYAGGWTVGIGVSNAGGLGYLQSAEVRFEIYAH